MKSLAVVECHPEAIAEAAAARRWYAERSAEAAEGFQAELDRAVMSMAEAPSRISARKATRQERLTYARRWKS